MNSPFKIRAWASVSMITLAVFLGFLSSAQDLPLRIESVSGGDGLSMNGILELTQDEKGYLWFRTDEGIVKYDGYTFKSFTQNPFDTNTIFQKVDKIYDANFGHLLINYNGLGFSFLDKNINKFYNYKPGSADNFNIGNRDVQCFYSNNRDSVWIGTDIGIYSYNFNPLC